jgi:hypothetical protein
MKAKKYIRMIMSSTEKSWAAESYRAAQINGSAKKTVSKQLRHSS